MKLKICISYYIITSCLSVNTTTTQPPQFCFHWFDFFWDRISPRSSGWPSIHCVTQINLELAVILLLQPSGCSDYRCVPPYSANLQRSAPKISVFFFPAKLQTSLLSFSQSMTSFLLQRVNRNHRSKYQELLQNRLIVLTFTLLLLERRILFPGHCGGPTLLCLQQEGF